MADRKNFSRYNMRCGVILHAAKGGVRISKIDAPEMDPRFLMLAGSDIPGDNTLTLFSTFAFRFIYHVFIPLVQHCCELARCFRIRFININQL